MDSGIIGESNGDLNSRSTKNKIVYTRRPRKKSSTATTTTSETHNDSTGQDVVVVDDAPKLQSKSPICKDDSCANETEEVPNLKSPPPKDDSCANETDEVANLKTPSPLDNAKKTPRAAANLGEHNLREAPTTSASEGEFVQVNNNNNNVNDNVNNEKKPLEETRNVDDDKVIFKLFKETPKNEIENLRQRLDCELHDVRMLLKRLEAKKIQVVSYNTPRLTNVNNDAAYVHQPQRGGEDFIDNRVLMRVNSVVESRPMVLSRINSDMGAMRNLEPRPYHRQLSVAVNHRDSDYVEKEKRTPKANQYYPNSEFLLGKDRLPPETNKRFKLNNGRKHNAQTLGFGSGFNKIRDRVLKSCSALLQKLMKHKFGWVFNVPVDAKGLGLVDYHIIIKYPMDLGTIKTRLSENRYASPMEFAEDVRLVFRNAMTYNPKGQDVHVMAEELSQIFEERWAVIETEYNPYLNGQMYHDLPTPTSGRVPAQSHFPRPAVLPVNMLARTESMAPNMAVDPKIHRPQIVRTPVPKKPKARDLNKRDMTYDEKQKLSSNLQGLPSEKLDAVVQIIKRRNTALSQHDDEIEVDIDNVDAETLWELDRFVTNYKKGLSKNKRKAELARQAGTVTNGTVVPMNPTPAVTAMQLERPARGESGEHRSGDGQNQQNNDNRSRSSSSSSSSSDSGSSSDSDSDSSSADGSSHSPKT